MKLKLLAAPTLAATLLLAMATPALAHVTTNPDSAPKGGEITLGFRVPNEVTNANVVKVDIAFPLDHPLLGIDTEPVAGWTSVVTKAKLSPPVQTDDGPVAEAVSEIAWTANAGGGTPPGSFQEFHLLVQRLPTDTALSVFKAIQTYSDGMVVSWIDPVAGGQKAPDHPTPTLALSAATDSGATPTTAASASGTTVDLAKLATKSSVSGATTTGIIGIVVGAVGLVVALVAVTRRPKFSATSPSTPSG